jgi:hypothetical protein
MPLDESFKFAKAFDRDGDGLVYDGTPRQRVARADERARHLGLMDRPMAHRTPSADRPRRPLASGPMPTKPIRVKRAPFSPAVPKPKWLKPGEFAKYRDGYIERLQPGQEIEVWRSADKRGQAIESLNVTYVGKKDDDTLVVRAWFQDGSHKDIAVKKVRVLVPGAILKSRRIIKDSLGYKKLLAEGKVKDPDDVVVGDWVGKGHIEDDLKTVRQESEVKKVRRVQDSQYWSAPVGTPITAGMRAAKKAELAGKKPASKKPGRHRASAKPTPSGKGGKAKDFKSRIAAAKKDSDIERIARDIGSGKDMSDDEYNDVMDALEAKLDQIEGKGGTEDKGGWPKATPRKAEADRKAQEARDAAEAKFNEEQNEARERDEYIARIKQAKSPGEAAKIEDEAAGKFRDEHYKRIMEARAERVRELQEADDKRQKPKQEGTDAHAKAAQKAHFDGGGTIADAPPVGLVTFLRGNDRFTIKSLDEDKQDSDSDDRAGGGISALDVVTDTKTGEKFYIKYATDGEHEMHADYVREELAQEVLRQAGIGNISSNHAHPLQGDDDQRSAFVVQDAVAASGEQDGELVTMAGLRGSKESHGSIMKSEVKKRMAMDKDAAQRLMDMYIFDYVVGNTQDRHMGNVFFVEKKDGSLKPLYLDHGLAFGGQYGGHPGVNEDAQMTFEDWEGRYRGEAGVEIDTEAASRQGPEWFGNWNISDYFEGLFDGDDAVLDSMEKSIKKMLKLDVGKVEKAFGPKAELLPDHEAEHLDAFYDLLRTRLAQLKNEIEGF